MPAFQKWKEPGSCTGRGTGVFIAILFTCWRLHFREAVFGREGALIILPNAGKEVIKSPTPGVSPKEKPLRIA